jgi:hypothetical protein
MPALVPLVVHEHADGFALVAGFHRIAAALSLGLAEVPVVVRDADTEEGRRRLRHRVRCARRGEPHRLVDRRTVSGRWWYSSAS